MNPPARRADFRALLADEPPESQGGLRRAAAIGTMSIDRVPVPPAGAAFVVDHELRYLVAEGDALQTAGFRPDDFIGKTIFEVLDPELARTYEPHYRKVLGGSSFALEHESHGRTFLSRGTPLRDATGRVHGAMVVSYDITERKRSELGARSAEEILSALIDNAPFGVIVVDGALRLKAANAAAEAAFGETASLLGGELAEVLCTIWQESAVASAIRHFQHTLASGMPYMAQTAAEALARHTNGAFYDWRIQRLTLPDGTFGVVCYFYDLTSIRRAERALKAAARRQGFLVALSDAITSLADAGEIAQTAAQRLGKYLGVTQARYLLLQDEGARYTTREGSSAPMMAAEEAASSLLPYGAALCRELERNEVVSIPDVNEDGRTSGVGTGHASNDASIRALACVPIVKKGRLVAALTLHHGSPHAWPHEDLELAKEVAERTWARVEAALADAARRRSEEQLRNLNRRKDEFLAILAHELRNPLAPIRTGLELLRLSGDKLESVASVRSLMERQLGQLVRLVDDLLDVSRINSGKIQLKLERTTLSSVVAAAVEAHQPALDAGARKLTIDLPETTVHVDVDVTRIIQVISNLLNNAIKFTHPLDRIELVATVEKSTRNLTLSVADSGIGMSPDALEHVFELFRQGDPRAAQGGLGIGLTLARRLVELHGGSLIAASPGLGQGSIFTLCAPVLSAPVQEEPAAPSSNWDVSVRVMVVDDNADAADTLALLIEAGGGKSSVAYDGESALREAEVFRPQVILVDIIMPGIDGYETCRRLRAAFGQEVLIVALSGLGQERDKQRAALASFDAYLTKPVEPQTLRRYLASAAR